MRLFRVGGVFLAFLALPHLPREPLVTSPDRGVRRTPRPPERSGAARGPGARTSARRSGSHPRAPHRERDRPSVRVRPEHPALLGHLVTALESTADQAAARKVGDPVVVAEALTSIARLELTRAHPAAGMGSGDLAYRVRRLTAGPPCTTGSGPRRPRGAGGDGRARRSDPRRLRLVRSPCGYRADHGRCAGPGIFRDSVLPFEAVSFVLLAALIGAAVLARKDDPR